MELNIETGAVHLPIARDGVPVGELTFSPQDVTFVEGFFRLYQKFEALSHQAPQGEGSEAEIFALLRALGETVRSGLDDLFGPGSGALVFGEGVYHPAVYAQFFEGLTQILSDQRKDLSAPYLPPEEENAQEDGLV